MILLVPFLPGDGHWYRALVLKVSESLVQVLYADYGKTEILPLSKVLPITESYLKLPFQTITCSLAGKTKTQKNTHTKNETQTYKQKQNQKTKHTYQKNKTKNTKLTNQKSTPLQKNHCLVVFLNIINLYLS